VIGPPEPLVALTARWADLYGDSKGIATIVTFLHVAPLLVGGGAALAIDRATLRTRATPEARARHLAELGAVHRLVLGALALTALSGIALLAADLETYWSSRIYWAKMLFVGLLVANGGVMTLTQRDIAAHPERLERGWTRLRQVALASIALWLTVTLLGVALRSFA
jgi:hypothetical protein